jgi:hypothetical protein
LSERWGAALVVVVDEVVEHSLEFGDRGRGVLVLIRARG